MILEDWGRNLMKYSDEADENQEDSRMSRRFQDDINKIKMLLYLSSKLSALIKDDDIKNLKLALLMKDGDWY